MNIECSDDFIPSLAPFRALRGELRPTPFTYSEVFRDRFDDAELALCHDSSLPPSQEPVDFKRHHYRQF